MAINCSHAASNIARNQSGTFIDRQKEIRRLIPRDMEKKFEVNQKVLIRSKRASFYKHSPLYSSIWEPDIYVIRRISKNILPYVYHLSKEDNLTEVKHLYAHDIMKFSFTSSSIQQTPVLKEKSSRSTDLLGKIIVKDVVLREPTMLRSGKSIISKSIPFYRVTINGKQDILPADSIKLFKKSIGNSVVYSDFFNDPVNRNYVI